MPICFYLPGNLVKHGTNYSIDQQRRDSGIAKAIYYDPVTSAAKYDTHDYEFLLALPTDADTIMRQLLNNNEGLIQRILKEGLVHIVQSLLERSTDPAILDKIPIDLAALTAKTFYCVAQAGNVEASSMVISQKIRWF